MIRKPRPSKERYLEYRRKKREDATDATQQHKHQRGRTFFQLAREFWVYVHPHRAMLGLALCTLSVSVLIGLAVPSATKIAIDYIITDHPGPEGLPEWLRPQGPTTASVRERLLFWLSGAMATVVLINVLIATWGRWQTTRITRRLSANMRRIAFEHAVRLPLHRLGAFKTGGVVAILREDAGQAAELVFNMIYNPWRAIIQLIGTLVVLAIVDWRMLLGGIAVIPATWITHRTWINRIRPVYRDIKLTRQGIDAHTTEVFGGMRVVRGFGRSRAESVRFTTASHFATRKEILVWWWSRILEMIWAVLIPGSTAAVLLYGGLRVIGGGLTIGDVMMFSTYLLMLLSPMETLTNTATNVQQNLASFDRVLDMLAEPTELSAPAANAAPGPKRFPDRAGAQGRIAIRNVTFTYPRLASLASHGVRSAGGPDKKGAHDDRIERPTEPALCNITLDVLPGETIALVGPSGSGKTTLCNLVARFYDPTDGQICLDGVPLTDIDLESYRRLLGIVEQDVFLFDGTVAENIAYGRRHATEAQIRAAARAANADEFIDRLERRYDTIIGERGVRLSGGQKQRLAIARALLADPVILILDEATSNLDSESEAIIQRTLAGLMRGRTSFVIAHRLSTIRNADRIVVLDHGRVVEVGTHDELLALSGRYAAMLKTQLYGNPRAGEDDLPLDDARTSAA